MNKEKVVKIHYNDERDSSTEPHVCPFREEIYNDTTTLCNCSIEQTKECAMDI